VRAAVGGDGEVWDRYVGDHVGALAYHRFAWKRAMEGAYGVHSPYLVAERRGRVCGVLPLGYVKPPMLRGALVSLPYCDVGGVLADDDAAETALVARAVGLARELGARGVELRRLGSRPAGGESKPVQVQEAPSKVRMILDLPGSSEALMAGFRSKHRSQVRKPEKDGLTCRLGGQELVEDFYGIFAENMRDLGSPVHSRRWIESVVESYGDDARVGVAYLPDGAPAAAGLVLMHRNTVSIPWASSLRRFNASNPNMLLYWTFLAFAADGGFERFDFGRSTPGEGTYRFKEQWGARPEPLRWERVEGEAVTPIRQASSGPERPGVARRLGERVIRHLPVDLATSLGSACRRYVSL
jgi:FemAB-related protein (PEP-CTERM system-associated)